MPLKSLPLKPVKALLCGGLLLVSSAFSYAEPVKLSLGHMFARNSLPDQAAVQFSDRLQQISHGQLVIERFPDGYFGDERRNLLQLNNGTLDFAITGDLVISYMAAHYSSVNMPFIYRDVDHAMAVYDGPIGAAIWQELREAHAIEVLGWHYIGMRLLTANRPITQLADLQGLQLRLPPDQVWTKTWWALGTHPKTVPFTDLKEALQRGRVDAQENPANLIRSGELYTVQKYLINTRHMPQRQFILAGLATLKRLTAEQQQWIRQAAAEAAEWTTVTAEQQQERDLKWLTTEGGMTLVEFDPRGITAKLSEVPPRLPGDAVQLFRQITAQPE